MMIPSLVDAHVHIDSPEWRVTVADAGVSAVREAGMDPAKRPGSAHTGTDKPLLVKSCWALYKEGGYGSPFGVAIGPAGGIKSEIIRLKQAGADIIKTMASGMVSLKHPGSITAGGFSRAELQVVVQEAAALGLGVMAHANGEEAIVAAAGAGVRSIEHGFFMTVQALELLAANRVFWVPTTGALVRAADSAGASQEARQFVSKLVQRHLDMIRLAHSFGVLLAVGTDCVLPDPNYRQAYEAELAYFREAGLSEDEVMKAATVNGMRLLGLN